MKEDETRDLRYALLQSTGRRRRGRRGSGLRWFRSGIFAVLGFVLLTGLIWGGIFAVQRLGPGASSFSAGVLENSREVTAAAFPQPAGTEPPGGLDVVEAVTGTEASSARETVAVPASMTPEEQVAYLMEHMTLEEKVAQMFIVTPEALTGVDRVYSAGEATRKAINQYPVGGFVYFKENIENPEQVKTMLSNVKRYSRDRVGVTAFTSVDEEGGSLVARIANNPAFEVEHFENMAVIGAAGDVRKGYQVGRTIGAYLQDLGFNLDYAPVADVLTNPENTVVKDRSFGSDPQLVSVFAGQVLMGLNEESVAGVLKHFPGHGATTADTHAGYAYTDKSLEQLMAADLVPFQAGINAGADFIMAGHIAAPGVTGDQTPASLSNVLLTDVLRGKMGFQNIIITDSLSMGAITSAYTSQQAAVAAVSAGVDILLMPANFQEAYEGLLNAVKTGVISEERINQSLQRILSVKVGFDQGD